MILRIHIYLIWPVASPVYQLTYLFPVPNGLNMGFICVVTTALTPFPA